MGIIVDMERSSLENIKKRLSVLSAIFMDTTNPPEKSWPGRGICKPSEKEVQGRSKSNLVEACSAG
jgi:hypothetical protein